MPNFIISEADAAVLRRILEQANKTPGRTINRPDVPTPPDNAPEVYIALTPPTGIPALVPDINIGTSTICGTGTHTGKKNTPGYGLCDVYRIVYTNLVPDLQQTGAQVTVHNIGKSAVPGNTWILVERDKYGYWVTGGVPATAVQCSQKATLSNLVDIICDKGTLKKSTQTMGLSIVGGCIQQSFGPVNTSVIGCCECVGTSSYQKGPPNCVFNYPTKNYCLQIVRVHNCDCLKPLPFNFNANEYQSFCEMCFSSGPDPCHGNAQQSGFSFTVAYCPGGPGQVGPTLRLIPGCMINPLSDCQTTSFGYLPNPGFTLSPVSATWSNVILSSIYGDFFCSTPPPYGTLVHSLVVDLKLFEGPCTGGTTGTGGGCSCLTPGMPNTIHATITNNSGCACMAGTYALTWLPGSQRWSSPVGGIPVCGAGNYITMTLYCSNNQMHLYMDCDGNALFSSYGQSDNSVIADTVNCSGPGVTFNNGGAGYGISSVCCTGNISVSIGP